MPVRQGTPLGGTGRICPLGREFAGGFNRVGGVDLSLRFFTNHKIQASYMKSSSRQPGKESAQNSPTYHLLYSYDTKPLRIMAAYEHIGKDFQIL